MIRSAIVSLVLFAAAAGCAKQPALSQASAPAPIGAATNSGDPVPGSVLTGAAPRTTASSPARRGPTTYTGTARPKPREFTEQADLQDVHFDFDRYELRDNDRLILDKHAAWMKDHPGTLLLVEGHCDERGTAEYNISLGDRRAKATANYLTSRGVASDRITMISYGEQRPVCSEHAESCWSRNRRAHFLVKEG
jgi:peptidoglycan-associated lipoprotein